MSDRGHHEGDREVAEGRERVPNQSPTKAVTVEVKVPVSIREIGQFDRVEGGVRQMVVEWDGSQVTLTSPSAQAGVQSISFPWRGVEAAINALETLVS